MVKRGSNQSDLIRTMFFPRAHHLYILLTLCRLWRCKYPRLRKSCFVPKNTLRKRLLEIVCYISWVFGEYPVAVIEYCCQDVESERQRSAVYDCQVHSLFSPKTQTRNQRRNKTNCSCNAKLFFSLSQSPEK